MNTIIKKIENSKEDEKIYKLAGNIIKDGGLVAFPTETVYGLGSNALDVEAIGKIYSAKGRPSDNPLILHIAKKQDLYKYGKEISENAEKLIEAFWPGPMTIVVKRTDIVPDKVTAGLDSVAIRMPKSEIARKLIATSGCPIVAPSANTSGKPSPTKASHVIYDMQEKIDMIIDGGSCEFGLESTVIDVTGDYPVILRPGSITKSMIESVCNKAEYDMNLKDQTVAPKSPGMKYKHYSPNANVKIISGEYEDVIKYINTECNKLKIDGIKTGVMTVDEYVLEIKADEIISLGSIKDTKTIGSKLFKSLRKMDELEVKEVFAMEIFGDENMVAIMNRLTKAAGHNIIKLR